MNKKTAIFNWSTGKDSAMALHLCLSEGIFDIRYLLTTLNRKYGRVSQHGVRESLLDKQAELIGIPLRKIWLPEQLDMDIYSEVMNKNWRRLKQESINVAIFGDIHLEHLRNYREKQLDTLSIAGEFPLWKKDTSKLAEDFIDCGFKAVVVSASEAWLDKSFVGRIYDRSFLKDLPADVDPCGEQGEFHTFVYDGPIFKEPVSWERGEIVCKKTSESTGKKNDSDKNICSSPQVNNKIGIWFCDIDHA